ncbi:MAG: hypothetical protein IKO74_04455 [Selenomonadaceae bacterium]|nr:hypothetical protein [Selenomonadaceae bacterium]
MKKKKVLVHGTQNSLQKFFSDAVSRDFEIVAALSDEKISINLEVLAPQNLPKFIYKMIDGIIFTGKNEYAANLARKLFIYAGLSFIFAIKRTRSCSKKPVGVSCLTADSKIFRRKCIPPSSRKFINGAQASRSTSIIRRRSRKNCSG